MASNAMFSPRGRAHELGRTRNQTARFAAQPPPPARGIPDRAASVSEGHDNVARFRITDTATLVISKGDITRWRIDGENDAIVNAANQRMLGGGGVDGAIHRGAGPRLREACERVPSIQGVRCSIGNAKITEGFDLPASRVIHTVGPIYDLHPNPAKLLKDCYVSSLDVAVAAGIEYIAFPAISCGVYGYPLHKAAHVSLHAIKQAQEIVTGIERLTQIHFIHFEKESYDEWMKVAKRQFLPT